MCDWLKVSPGVRVTDVVAIKKRKPSLRDCLWTAHAFGTGMADDDDSDSDSMTPLVDVDVSDDEDYEPNAMPAPATAVRRSARNRDKEVDYVHEKHDNSKNFEPVAPDPAIWSNHTRTRLIVWEDCRG